MLSPRRLLVLREFVAQGTIAGAAEALAFTPSAISQQLAQLQREAGVELFRRSGRRLVRRPVGGKRSVGHEMLRRWRKTAKSAREPPGVMIDTRSATPCQGGRPRS